MFDEYGTWLIFAGGFAAGFIAGLVGVAATLLLDAYFWRD